MNRFALGVPELVRRLDGSTARWLGGVEQGFRAGGVEAQQRAVANRSAEDAGKYIASRYPEFVAREQAAGDQGTAFRRQMAEDLKYQMSLSPEQRQQIEAKYAPNLNRGPFGGERGLGESAAAWANRPVVRRSGLGAAGAGAVAGTGALLTEGAQQLMTLMDFLQAGEDTRERAERSPLT